MTNLTTSAYTSTLVKIDSRDNFDLIDESTSSNLNVRISSAYSEAFSDQSECSSTHSTPSLSSRSVSEEKTEYDAESELNFSEGSYSGSRPQDIHSFQEFMMKLQEALQHLEKHPKLRFYKVKENGESIQFCLLLQSRNTDSELFEEDLQIQHVALNIHGKISKNLYDHVVSLCEKMGLNLSVIDCRPLRPPHILPHPLPPHLRTSHASFSLNRTI